VNGIARLTVTVLVSWCLPSGWAVPRFLRQLFFWIDKVVYIYIYIYIYVYGYIYV
jgi:hypothetical protein